MVQFLRGFQDWVSVTLRQTPTPPKKIRAQKRFLESTVNHIYNSLALAKSFAHVIGDVTLGVARQHNPLYFNFRVQK